MVGRQNAHIHHRWAAILPAVVSCFANYEIRIFVISKVLQKLAKITWKQKKSNYLSKITITYNCHFQQNLDVKNIRF